ncbi:MAG: metalloregulator ArsR/SmtB family transcription factor [Candidatus Thermoplasmatota archaeon]|nr:metalloregulator ArsR/SmtB family transcription factor [Candidatus Thermoplasmatota archaeon]
MPDPDPHQALRASAEALRPDPTLKRLRLWGKALSDETRLVILYLLETHNELSATDLRHALGVSHAAVSQHMRLLHEAGMVHSRRRGKWVFYGLEKHIRGMLEGDGEP